MATPTSFAKLTWRLHLVWASVTLASLPYMWAFFPETSGRTCGQMDDFFAKYQNRYMGLVANEWLEKDTVSDGKVMEVSQRGQGFEHKAV
jgi:hypothetical protein